VVADTPEIDLEALALRPGEGTELECTVTVEGFSQGDYDYTVSPSPAPVNLVVSRTVTLGYVLHIRSKLVVDGPCVRCLEPAQTVAAIDTHEVHEAGDDLDLRSAYIDQGVFKLAAWLRDTLLLQLPAKTLCMSECEGLCTECGVNLNTVEGEHRHEKSIDPRWQKLSEIEFQDDSSD